MKIRTFTGSGFGENAYLLACEATDECVVVDPGDAAPAVVSAIEADGLSLQAILLTHAHLDHIEGVSTVRAAAPDVPIWLHPEDLTLYRSVRQQAAMFGLDAKRQPDPTHELVPGEEYRFGDCILDVRFTPGHAPGHVIFVNGDDGVVLVGDVVFQRSIGRTDLPGGDLRTLMRSIREQVLTLPDDTVLLPGHGPPTTVGEERVGNPFIAPSYGGGLA